MTTNFNIHFLLFYLFTIFILFSVIPITMYPGAVLRKISIYHENSLCVPLLI